MSASFSLTHENTPESKLERQKAQLAGLLAMVLGIILVGCASAIYSLGSEAHIVPLSIGIVGLIPMGIGCWVIEKNS